MKRKIVSIVLILAMFTVLVAYGENIDDQYDVTLIEIEDLLDSKYFDDEDFKFDDFYFSSENGIRNVVTYVYNGVLKDENMRVKLQFSKTLNKEATQALLDNHFEELDNVITDTGRRRDPDFYLELIYPDHMIKKDNQSALSYNYHKMKALWYPGSGGVATLLNNVIYMTPEQVEETSKALGFDFN